MGKLDKREQKSAHNSERANEKRILEFENEIMRYAKTHILDISKTAIFSDFIGTGLDPLKNQSDLKTVFLKMAEKLKDPDASAAFKWVAGFQTDSRAKQFLEEVSPQGFAGLHAS